MVKQNILFAHSGGVTPVINTIACGVIQRAHQGDLPIGKVLAARNGILGVLHEDIIDTQHESAQDISGLYATPGSAFGSCRYKLKNPPHNKQQYQRLLDVFKAHNIGYFLYNGGNDSQDTAHKIWQMSQQLQYPLVCMGIPKTIDNDLPFTDCCPGFGSVAKYIATSTKEASMDIASMYATSTKVFILEVMGRHAGWIAAASGLAQTQADQGPHIILLPEVRFDLKAFLQKVTQCTNDYGYCVVVASEGLRTQDGKFLSETGLTDAFGHAQLGGVAPQLAQWVQTKLQLKTHWSVADYLQRSARHLASQVDVDQAYQLGQTAVEWASQKINGVMLTIERLNDRPYRWEIGKVALEKVANVEKFLPDNMIATDGMHITASCKTYLHGLIQGEAYPSFHDGLPQYAILKNQPCKKQLDAVSANCI